MRTPTRLRVRAMLTGQKARGRISGFWKWVADRDDYWALNRIRDIVDATATATYVESTAGKFLGECTLLARSTVGGTLAAVERAIWLSVRF
jgi:hypothetical protein